MQAGELKSWDLELDDVDRRFGIVHAVAVTCGRTTVVIVEGSDYIRNDVHTGKMPDRALRSRARFEAEAAE